MVNLSFSTQEVDMLKQSINNCINTCKEGGPHHGCPKCESLEGILNKLP